MSITISRSLLSLAAVAAFAIASAQTSTPPAEPPVTLHVGDMAPPVAGVTWLKGQPLNNLADGSVHVVEFWATWCGPCKAAMPGLSRLAAQYKGRVTFTGIDVWESPYDKSVDYMPKVKEFVEHAHGKMAYNVGADDPAGDMTNSWLFAAGQHGIPCTFVIDGDGRIAYIGLPIFLDELLPRVLDHTFDAKAFKAASHEQLAKLRELDQQIEKAGKERDVKTILDLLDEEERTLPFSADGVAVRRYGVLAVTDPPNAHFYGEKLLKRFQTSPDVLCSISRMSVGDDVGYYSNAALGVVKTPDPELALEAVKQAQRFSGPSDIFVNSTVAEVMFKTGNPAKAVEYQSRVVKAFEADKGAHMTDKSIAEARSKLESYKAAAGSAGPKPKAG